MSSRGKKFEQAVREAFEKIPDVSIDRLPDPTGGYLGVRNICDFMVYKKPHLIYLECKVQGGNTLNWSRITENQWNGMKEKTRIAGTFAGILVWFVNHDITAFVPIQEMIYLKSKGKKSLHINDLVDGDALHIPIMGRKKRVFFDYDFRPFLDEFSTWNIIRGGWRL